MLKRMIVQASLWYPECDKEADICYPMRGVMVLFPVRVQKKQMENQPAKTCTLKCIVSSKVPKPRILVVHPLDEIPKIVCCSQSA